jgi:hypothetical protein
MADNSDLTKEDIDALVENALEAGIKLPSEPRAREVAAHQVIHSGRSALLPGRIMQRISPSVEGGGAEGPSGAENRA